MTAFNSKATFRNYMPLIHNTDYFQLEGLFNLTDVW